MFSVLDVASAVKLRGSNQKTARSNRAGQLGWVSANYSITSFTAILQPFMEAAYCWPISDTPALNV
jgi:hypothetical protein